LDRQAEVQRLLLRAARLDRERRYTLHRDFTADDPAGARELVVALATGLGLLRPEVETYSARLSAGDRCAAGRPVFCLADGPEGAFCMAGSGMRGGTPRAVPVVCGGARKTRRARRDDRDDCDHVLRDDGR
jgi:hypothetical protein